MKNSIFLKQIFVAVIIMMTMLTAHAQPSEKVENTVNDIVNRYDGKDKVSCITATKGNGLELIKMMFRQQFGKEFMKGVKSITIIDYSDASENTCASLRKDLDVFLSMLEEFDLSEEKDFSENKFIRCFASSVESSTLSDFVVALENDESKMILYMSGTIKVE